MNAQLIDKKADFRPILACSQGEARVCTIHLTINDLIVLKAHRVCVRVCASPDVRNFCLRSRGERRVSVYHLYICVVENGLCVRLRHVDILTCTSAKP